MNVLVITIQAKKLCFSSHPRIPTTVPYPIPTTSLLQKIS